VDPDHVDRVGLGVVAPTDGGDVRVPSLPTVATRPSLRSPR
jgi:hypothetical protein